MTWTSSWLPLWILLWFLMATLPPRRWQGGAMLATAGAFLGWADWRGLVAIIVASMVTWFFLRGPRPSWFRSGSVIVLVVSGFVATKCYVQNDDHATMPLLGVAFAALRLIHVTAEVTQGRVTCADYWGFMRYLLFLPAVIAGPVHRLDVQQRDENRRRWDPQLVSAGAERVLYGFVKIVVLAGWLETAVQARVTVDTWHPAAEAWFFCFWYGWDLYFQFSGYSDVAIGLALAAGYRLPENFSFPFLATNIQEFWRRWHASLSTWCRAYVAEPVLAATRTRWIAIICSMLVLGLWHEISLRYCAWGLFHGIGIAVYHSYRNWRGPLVELSGPVARAKQAL
jgi:D-alanyl-lipoteichoic acid acyltransferase DltB (MBOAT superfamily)